LRTAKVSELAYDPVQGVMTVATEPPPPPGAADLPGMLILHGRSLADGRLLPEVYAVVAVPDPRGPNRPCVFRLSISPQSPAPLRTARDAFLGRPAYLVPGFGVDLELPLPTLLVDIPRTKLRCRVYAHSSAAAPPQLPAVDPDAPGFASAAKASFQAPQRLPPADPEHPAAPAALTHRPPRLLRPARLLRPVAPRPPVRRQEPARRRRLPAAARPGQRPVPHRRGPSPRRQRAHRCQPRRPRGRHPARRPRDLDRRPARMARRL
jgi:hypothetical protein